MKKAKKSNSGIRTDHGCDDHHAQYRGSDPAGFSCCVFFAAWDERIFEVITRKRVLSSFYVSFITALGASLVNAMMGLILAWVLVRYEFPGKRIMDGMIELPFALPTAVAGISLTS